MRINKETVLGKFLRYVAIDTQSNPFATTFPSTSQQTVFAGILAEELRAMGASEVLVDENGYVMATILATTSKPLPVIGLIAHLDTAPDMSGSNIKPQVIEQYTGGNIVLNCEKNIVLRESDFPELKNYYGQTIVTTDGTTLLGADDKAGIAAIMSAAEYLLSHNDIRHGTVRIAFTPDEEIGRGADRFDVQKFGADYAYTFDGGEVGELEYENFNAAEALVTIDGCSIHPGYAKGRMINAINVAHEFHAALPSGECPEKTACREGFFHLVEVRGSVEQTVMNYIIRDFDHSNFERRKILFANIAKQINEKYGTTIVQVQLRDQYYNMYEKILPCLYIVEKAEKAMRSIDIAPIIKPIRGGTDGARLSFMGLPCPNIFAGGHNPHGKFEFVPVESMQKAAEVILCMVEHS